MNVSPRPWQEDAETIIDANGVDVVGLCEDDYGIAYPAIALPGDRALIVRCVNAHDKLVEALKNAQNIIDSHREVRECNQAYCPEFRAQIKAALKEAGEA